MPEQEQTSIEKLRAEYYQLIDQPLPQRAKGVPYTRILGPSLLMMVFSYIILIFIFFHSWGESFLLLIGFALMWLFVFLPREFYDDRKRTYRHAKRHYPAVLHTLARLVDQRNREFLFRDLPLLKVEGRRYFLAAYIYQRQWDPRPNVRFTGWLLLDMAGKVIADDELFGKALLTHSYASLGAAEVQRVDGNEEMRLSNDLRSYTTRAAKFLRSQRDFFEQNGALQDWQSLMDGLPILYEAGKDALSIYRGRENVRKAMGYSFGLEFDYQDALPDERMNRAFSRYMRAAYGEPLEALQASLERLARCVEMSDKHFKDAWNRIPKTILPMFGMNVYSIDAANALNQVQKTILTITNLILRMEQTGIPSPEDWALYRTKLVLAKERGFVIVHPPHRADKTVGEMES